MIQFLWVVLSLPLLSIQNPHLQMIYDINPTYLDLYLHHEDVLVEYYFPLCSTCPRMRTVLDYLTQELVLSSLLTIFSIDCRKYSNHCRRNQIQQYPAWVRIEKNGSITAINNSESLLQTLNKYNISKNNLTLPRLTFNDSLDDDVCIPGQVLKLKSEYFFSHINNGTYFVKLYSPSCVSCIRLFAIWNELASELVNETKVCIAEYDCTSGMQICRDLQITRIPALIWFKNGKRVEKYNGNRDKKGLRNFVSNMIMPKNSQSSAHQQTFSNIAKLTMLLNIICGFYIQQIK
ncbi:hypothetical protein KR084_000902 [Drosophila pseudotakahashii]|nr:hypothetical protein KR084_000902 [Drosophila pseudotakahashii]